MRAAPSSPYAEDWNYGVMPTPGYQVTSTLQTADEALAVLLPDVFMGVMRARTQAGGNLLWFGCDGGLHIASDGRFWCQSQDGQAWTEWQETNAWWVRL